jgi:NAD(P)-dependent dehydrogenase (short-subunit alcohol dehydrogenase family)
MDRGAALVTGARARLGRELALSLAKAGYAVAVHHRDDAGAAQAVADEIVGLGGRAAIVAADLAQESHTRTLIARSAEALGVPLTLLVNNASRFSDDRVGRLDRAGWDQHMEANLRAPVVLAEDFARQAPEGSNALILNILDQRVWRPNPQFFSYTLSKSALWTATRMLAQALAPKVRVNGIGPGPTLPSIHQDDDAFAAEAAAIPMQHSVSPDEICAAALYLVDARSVTGQMIAVDGGQHLAWKTPDILDD